MKAWGKKEINKHDKTKRTNDPVITAGGIYIYIYIYKFLSAKLVRSFKETALGGCIHHGRFPLGVKIARRTRRSSRRITGTGDVLSQGITRLTGSKRATSRRGRVLRLRKECVGIIYR